MVIDSPNTSRVSFASAEPRFVESAEFRRLTYKMFRMQGEYRPGRPYHLPAWKAWELTRRYVEAVR
jgi:hypothetical protein